MRALILSIVALVLATPAHAGDGDATFKDWWSACDTVRVCTVYGFPEDDGGDAVLRVQREAQGDAVPEVDVNLGPEPSKGVVGPLTLAVDGKVAARTGPPQGAEDEYRSWPVAPSAASALLAAVTRGQALEVRSGAKTVATVSLAGASAALRWMDDRQKRVGGVTAVVAKGPAPASAVPAPPALPLIRAAKPVAQKGLGSIPPPAVIARLKSFDCEPKPPEEPTSNRLAPGVVLWVVPCWVGAYQISSALVLADEKGGNARLADLGGGGDADGRAMATNADFDTDTQQLHSYAKGRGIADCGIATTHAWTGKAFVLTDRTELSVCRGLSQDFWITTFRSR